MLFFGDSFKMDFACKKKKKKEKINQQQNRQRIESIAN